MSAAPSTVRAPTDSQTYFDSPKTTVAAPNTATAPNISRPARRRIVWLARITATSVAPTAGAARSTPKPSAPTCSTSRANTGSRAVAPPSNTANKSSEIEPKTILLRQV